MSDIFEPDKIIEEAKKRFPIGTKCSNVNINCGCRFTITGTEYRSDSNSVIINNCSTKDGGGYTIYRHKEGWCQVLKYSQEVILDQIREIIKE